jgi:hypothetical protein
VWLPNTNCAIRIRDVLFINELFKDKPSTPSITPCMIEAVHIPEEEYDGDTIVVSQPISQRQGPVSQTSKGVQQLLSSSTTPQARNTPDPRGTPDPHGTHSLDRRNRSSSPDPVERQILQELPASRNTLHTIPGGWNFDENTDNLEPTREPYIPN